MQDKPDNRPLYEIIYDHYKNLITSGVIPVNKQLPTESEIAEQFQVSRITVVRALKELEIQNHIYRVQGSGSYVKKQAASYKAVKNNQMAIISLIIPFDDTNFTDVLAGLEDKAKERGFFVTVHNSNADPKKEQEIVEEVIARGSHGIIIYPSSSSENVDLYFMLTLDRYPFIVIDRKLQGITTSLVEVDNESSFATITNHLIAQGHKKIVFVGTSIDTISSEYERYQGFCKAHMEHRVPLLKKHLYQRKDADAMPQDYLPHLTQDERECHFFFDTLATLPEAERPTAIAVVNDSVAEVLMLVANTRGIAIPAQYAMSGFDNLPLASHTNPPLTTIQQPSYEIGTTAAEELFHIIDEPSWSHTVHTLPGRLIERASTAKPTISATLPNKATMPAKPTTSTQPSTEGETHA